jgi:putative heme-binding domain-containing protein
MALRNHLQSGIVFSRLVNGDLSSSNIQLVGSLCMSLKTPPAGEFVAAHIDQLAGTDHDQLARYIKFAVGYVSRDTIATLAKTALDRFGDDLDFQLALLDAVKTGLSQRGVAPSESVRAWATVVAEQLLDTSQSDNTSGGNVEPLSWTQIQYLDGSSQVDSWTVSHTRKSADGVTATPLWSSFPRGERRTGIYRSAPFTLPADFSFFLAGHDGFPDKPPQQKNYVQVRDALSREVLERWSPHRNDTAQQIKWKTRDVAGRQVFIELVDGDADSAYAWLAVGRFSVEALNPSHRSERRRKGAELAAAFKLDQFRNAIGKVALKMLTDPISVRVLANALSQMTSRADARMTALAESTSIVGLNILQRREMVQALMNGQRAAVPALLLKAMLSASTTEQRRVAEVLASDSGGAALLVELAEAGRLSARLLKYPQIEPKLLAASDDPLRKRITALTSRVPDESKNLIELIASRRQNHSSSPGDRELGTKLFARTCANCHQIAGQGKKVGPNLDGIGNRGLDRLVEDILAPNRNVDVAFRTSTIVTDQGRVLNGLIKRTEGARMVLVDSKGEEITVATDTIDQNVLSNLSPMPANFGETLSEEQFRHLIAYLLSLRSS